MGSIITQKLPVVLRPLPVAPCLGAGLANQRLSYVGNQLVLNYTGGETCHDVYTRSTEIYFTCHPDRRPVSFTCSGRVRAPQAEHSALFDNH